MKFIKDSYIEKPKLEIAFNRYGQTVTKETKEKSYAKVIGKSGDESYYIRVHEGVPYDPLGPFGKRENYIETKMKKVSKNTFDFYMMYLKTNNSIYMTKAQRGFLNE